MATREDIDSYLIRAGLPHEEVGPDMWVIHEPDTGENIVVSAAGPVLLFRLKVMELAKVSKSEELYRTLLTLNAGDMVHGAYGIADDAIVLTCALRLENLDYNEFQGTIDDFALALTNHYKTLAAFRNAT